MGTRGGGYGKLSGGPCPTDAVTPPPKLSGIGFAPSCQGTISRGGRGGGRYVPPSPPPHSTSIRGCTSISLLFTSADGHWTTLPPNTPNPSPPPPHKCPVPASCCPPHISSSCSARCSSPGGPRNNIAAHAFQVRVFLPRLYPLNILCDTIKHHVVLDRQMYTIYWCGVLGFGPNILELKYSFHYFICALLNF